MIRYHSYDLDLQCDPIIRKGQRYLIGQIWISGNEDDTLTDCWIRLTSRNADSGDSPAAQILPTFINVKGGKELVFPFQIPISLPAHPEDQEDEAHPLAKSIRANFILQVKTASDKQQGGWHNATPLHVIAA